MEKLEYKYDVLMKSSKALLMAITLFQERYEDADMYERATYVASVVKHFELFYEMLWKFLKFYLLEKHGIETTGSKDVFRAIFAKNLINQQQLDLLMNTVGIRNTTSHAYDPDFALALCKEIVHVYPAMQQVIAAMEIPVD